MRKVLAWIAGGIEWQKGEEKNLMAVALLLS